MFLSCEKRTSVAQSNPIVTVVITHHLDENAEYLRLCLEALGRQKGVAFEALVMADTVTCPVVPDWVTLTHDPALSTATKKFHFGIKMAAPTSQYFMHLSDDVMMSQGALARCVNDLSMIDNAIMNPLSNGDLGSRFLAPLALMRPGGQMRPMPLHSDANDLHGWEAAVMDFESPYANLIISQEWVTFFCTLIPRKVWERVGLLDERLETRHNDQDWCLRARQMGVISLINFSAFAFHFGSRTLSKSCKAGEQDEASDYFRMKWGRG